MIYIGWVLLILWECLLYGVLFCVCISRVRFSWLCCRCLVSLLLVLVSIFSFSVGSFVLRCGRRWLSSLLVYFLEMLKCICSGFFCLCNLVSMWLWVFSSLVVWCWNCCFSGVSCIDWLLCLNSWLLVSFFRCWMWVFIVEGLWLRWLVVVRKWLKCRMVWKVCSSLIFRLVFMVLIFCMIGVDSFV